MQLLTAGRLCGVFSRGLEISSCPIRRHVAASWSVGQSYEELWKAVSSFEMQKTIANVAGKVSCSTHVITQLRQQQTPLNTRMRASLSVSLYKIGIDFINT